jgi:hypothetical protein
MQPLILLGMNGLGDNIYQRAVLRELAKQRTLYLQTSWPQFYSDLPIWCLPASTRLRTQSKNLAREDLTWAAPPHPMTPSRKLHYVNRPEQTILQALCEAAGLKLDAVTFDLPSFAPADVGKPYIVIRPATVRMEWRAEGRNPKPEYLAQAAERLRRHFHIISVADLSEGQEWPVLPLPYADQQFHAGELSVEELLALVQGAAGVVGGVGWLVPAAIAYQVPMLLIFGGWGFHNGPKRIFDHRLNTRQVRQVLPAQFCLCSSQGHGCDKSIPDFADHVERWTLELLEERQAAMVA